MPNPTETFDQMRARLIAQLGVIVSVPVGDCPSWGSSCADDVPSVDSYNRQSSAVAVLTAQTGSTTVRG